MRNSIVALIISISLILATTAQATIHDIMVSNNTSARVHISWITNDATTGEVHYSTNPDLSNPSTAYDTRGQSFAGCTHYVEIKNLAKETTYYFEVVTGSETDNNNGSFYTFTTMKEPSALPGICLHYGNVYQEDGTTAVEGAIVYLRLTHAGVDSYPLSELSDAAGGFVINLREARSVATDDLFSSIDGGDPLHLEAVYCNGCADARDLVFEECTYDCGAMIFTCNTDTDGDSILDKDDNCPETPNGPDSGTCSAGTIGNPCMTNGNCGCEGYCSIDQEDADGEGVGDVCDNYPLDYDNDGVCDPGESPPTCAVLDDNCPEVPNGPVTGSCFNYFTHEVWGECLDNSSCRENNEGWWIWCDTMNNDMDGDGVGDVCDPTP